MIAMLALALLGQSAEPLNRTKRERIEQLRGPDGL